jgi:hypothetical protein
MRLLHMAVNPTPQQIVLASAAPASVSRCRSLSLSPSLTPQS